MCDAFVPGSDIGSFRSGRTGLCTSEAKPDDVAMDYNSRLRGAAHFRVQTRNLRKIKMSMRYFVDLSDFYVSSWGSVLDFWREPPAKHIRLRKSEPDRN